MKVKAIIVDELPKSCEDCIFKCMPVGEKSLFGDLCPLVTDEDYPTLKNYSL